MRTDCRTIAHPFLTRGRRLCGLALILMVLVALVPTSGCTKGCRKSAAPPAKKKTNKPDKEKAKKKKPDFEIGEIGILPKEESGFNNWVKPGHFVATSVKARANHFDFRGQFETKAVDRANQPILINGTNFHVSTTRTVALPKGQEKNLESIDFIPRYSGDASRTSFLRQTLRPVGGGRIVHQATQGTRQMPACQYLMVVLASNPNAYGYLKQLTAVRSLYNELSEQDEQVVYYRVILPTIQSRHLLPAHPFAWTSIAYIVWDGMQPSELSSQQKAALLVWLHWGGQLVISGPDSLDRLKGSFLDAFLPASTDGTVALGPDQLRTLNSFWSLTDKKTGQRQILDVSADLPLVGANLIPRPGAGFLEGTGQLVAESRVGRGRVVVTSFALTSRNVINWPCFDSFFNGALMRRPPRTFGTGKFGSPTVSWADAKKMTRDPRFSTTLRFFSRDISPLESASQPSVDSSDDRQLDSWRADPISGVCGWNDRSGTAEAAHRSLRNAAGIKIPDARFVLRMLAFYLFALVGLNWGIFRLLGRVEWAWIAAPVIATAGAIAVIHFAQLDIGFARSRTEIDILEVQGSCEQAHLTRYMALYTSLASGYDVRFDASSAVAFPFPPTSSPSQPWPITIRRDREILLSGFQVNSNKTGFLHCEQMLDLGGVFALTGEGTQWTLNNGTELDLQDTTLLARDSTGRLLSCLLGPLPSKTTATFHLTSTSKTLPWVRNPKKTTDNEPDQSAADLREIFQLATSQLALRSGDIRLVARTDQSLPGTTIRPAAPQSRIATVVLVHLRYGPFTHLKPDVNLLSDVRDADIEPDLKPESDKGPPKTEGDSDQTNGDRNRP